jgi:hypothetical protein
LQDDDTWSPPVFISELNTSGNEITPFLLSEDTLFFASNGQGGPGGYDIFYSVKSKGLWQKPFPLSGLNTEYNESDFILLANSTAIFSSDRPGGKGGLDLWSSVLETETQKTQEYLADFELSIALQASNIKIHRDMVYDNYYIPLIIKIDHEEFPRFSARYPLSAACGSFEKIDSVYYNIFSLIAEQAVSTKGRIVINAYGNFDNQSETINPIIDHFSKTYGINREKFIVQSIKNINSKSSFISFLIEGTNYSSFYKLGKDSISLMPPVVELSIDARPRKLMKSWELETLINNDQVISQKSGTEVPSRVFSDLRQHKCDLIYSDSVVFNITGIDSIGRKARESIKLPVSHSISERADISIYSQKEYNSYYVLLFDPIFLDKFGFYDEFFEKIKSVYKSGKSVIVNDYTTLFNNNLNIRDISNISYADELVTSLKTRCRINDKDIELNYISSQRKISPFSIPFNPYVFEVMIEK